MAATQKITEDSYYLNFGKGEYLDLKKAQTDLEDNTSWERDIKKMVITPMDTPMEAEIYFNTPGHTIPKEILLDTADNCGLMINYDDKEECLRDCAMPSLLSTVSIRGEGLFRPEKNQQAIALTALLTGCREHSTIMRRAGKVAAIVSPKYEHMPIPELLNITDDLDQYLGDPEFISGCVSHSLTVAKFQYPDAAQTVTDTYRTILAAHGRTLAPGQVIIPVVEFRSSDTTGEAAKLLTYLQLSPGHLMPIGEGVRVNHVMPYEFDELGNRLSGIRKFRHEAQLLYSQLDYDIKELVPAMLETSIEHPANTFVGLCKKAQIPQKWGGQVEEEIRNDWPNASGCTFLDVYEYLTSITKKALEENSPHGTRLLDLEEAIARIAHNRALWTKYDLPGTVAWVQAVNKKANATSKSLFHLC